MKILLLGKDGQVGTELKRALLPLGELMAIGRSDLDLQKLSALNLLLKKVGPDIIINAAAYTSVDKAERFPEMAFEINEQVVSVLAEYAEINSALLVHYSTDYVFDGEKKTAYIESDFANPQSIYGASKLAGEKALSLSNCNFLLFRTSWVFSVYGNNFIKTILRMAQERTSLQVVADQYGAPTSAELIADVTALAVLSYREGRINRGIYHLTPTGLTSWHELAYYVVQRAISNQIKLKITADQIHPITTEEYPLPAKRPKNSALNSSLLSNTLNLQLPDWRVYVDRMIDQLTKTRFFE